MVEIKKKDDHNDTGKKNPRRRIGFPSGVVCRIWAEKGTKNRASALGGDSAKDRPSTIGGSEMQWEREKDFASTDGRSSFSKVTLLESAVRHRSGAPSE